MQTLDFNAIMESTVAAIGLAYDSPCVALATNPDGTVSDSWGLDSFEDAMRLDPFTREHLAPMPLDCVRAALAHEYMTISVFRSRDAWEQRFDQDCKRAIQTCRA